MPSSASCSRWQSPLRVIIGSFAAGALALGLQACGSSDDEDETPAPTPTTIQGTVAVGAALPGATVTVTDADAATADVAGTADENGKYAIDVSSQKAPLVVTATGTLNGEPVTIKAVVPTLTGEADNNANVTSLTNAVAALIAPGGDLNALADPAVIAGISPDTVADASSLVVNTLVSNPEFASLLGDGFDPLTTPFVADGTGIDSVLDQVQIDVTTDGVAITNLTAPISDDGSSPPPVVLTAEQVSDPASAPTLPPSVPAEDLPSPAEMLALAKKLEDCLALPLDQRVTLDADKEVTAVSDACSFAPADWKSDGGNWADRVGTNLLRYGYMTGSKAGQPTVAAVFEAPNYSGTTFQHPYCNTARCVAMNIPLVSASGKPSNSFWQLAKVAGQWNFVGNQLPYALGAEHRINKKVAVNTALAALDPLNYYRQDRIESVIRLIFNPEASGAEATADIRAVVWKGPGLPDAGVVTHRSQRCFTDDRFPITNQEGLLTVNNSSQVQFWNNGGGVDFIIDAAKFDGSVLTMPTPTSNWATNPQPSNQDVRSAPFTGSIPAWATYRAEIYTFANTTSTPDRVVVVRSATPFEPAAAGAAKNWPVLSQGFIDQYLKPTGASAGTLNTLAQTMAWTNPSDGYVGFATLFAQNRLFLSNGVDAAANYWKRNLMYFRPDALGDESVAAAYEWSSNLAGTALSPSTQNIGSNPNPRCGVDDLVPLDADNTNFSYREAALGFRGPDRKQYLLINFWTNQ